MQEDYNTGQPSKEGPNIGKLPGRIGPGSFFPNAPPFPGPGAAPSAIYSQGNL